MSPRVRQVHPRPNDVRQREARVRERALDDLEHRPRLGRGIAGMLRVAVRAGVGGPGHVARLADDDRPGVAVPGLPRPAAGDASRRSLGAGATSARRATPAIDGIAGDLEQERGEQRRPGHDRVDLEVLLRRMIHAADRPEAVDRRDAHP